MPVVFKNKMTCKALAKKNKNLVSKRQLNTTHGAKSPRPLCDRPASPHRSRCGEIQAELLRVQLPVHITVFTQLEFELFSLSQASTPSPPPPLLQGSSPKRAIICSYTVHAMAAIMVLLSARGTAPLKKPWSLCSWEWEVEEEGRQSSN